MINLSQHNLSHQIVWNPKPGKRWLTIIRGIPGSGKSTYATRLACWANGLMHLEADMYHSRFGSYDWQAEENPRAHRWCLNTAQIILSQGKDVIVANTFTRFKEMADYVCFAANGYGLDVRTMHGDYGNIHNVPEETMKAMRNRFESHEDIIKQCGELRNNLLKSHESN